METWNQRILLTAALLGTICGGAVASDEQLIIPELERREIRSAAIDSENFEVGAFTGIISIQDFDSEIVYGIRAAWHVSEDEGLIRPRDSVEQIGQTIRPSQLCVLYLDGRVVLHLFRTTRLVELFVSV